MANTGATDYGDDIYVVVKRTIDGSVVRYIEQFSPRFLQYTPSIEQAFFVDSGITTYDPVTITGATAADPVVITAAAHGFADDDLVDIRDIFEGMVELLQDDEGNTVPNKRYKVANKATNTFELQTVAGVDIDGTGFTAYTTGGTVANTFTAISGLDHLEGEDVAVLANGFIVSGLTVASGAITLPAAASIAHVGLPFKSEMLTLNLELQIEGGTLQDKKRSIDSVMVRLQNTNALWIGTDEDNRLEVEDFRTTEDFGTPTAMFTGDKYVQIQGSYGESARLYVKNEDPLPLTILALIPRVGIGGV